jgi:hypothetical protein
MGAGAKVDPTSDTSSCLTADPECTEEDIRISTIATATQ